MARDHSGQPSGTNKSEGTGKPADKYMEDQERDRQQTDRYTEEDGNIAEGVRQANTNRNVDKTDATNAGGYKN